MASLIETFGILFESDADDVKKGVNDAEDAAEDLESKLDDVDKTAEELGESFLDIISSAKGAIAGIVGFGALVGGVLNAAQMTDEVGKFSETLGLNVEDVGAWSEAVARSGGDVNSFRGSIQSLTSQLTDFALTGGGPAADVLARIGVNATNSGGKVKSAFDILPELADRFSQLSKADSFAFGQKLGLDQGTILLLQQGRVAVENLVDRQKKLGVATQEDYLIAAKFNDQWDDTKQVFNSLFVTVGTTVLPGLASILGLVQDMVFFLADNSDLVVGFFVGAGVAILSYYLPAIGAAAASTLIAIAPFLTAAAAVLAIGAAFALIYDDIQSFIKGNDSIVGRIADKYPAIGELVKGLIVIFKGLFEIIMALGGVLADVFTTSLGTILTVLDELVGAVLSAINAMLGGFTGLGDGMESTIKSAVDSIIDLIKSAGGVVTDFLDSISDAASGISDFFSGEKEAKIIVEGDSEELNNQRIIKQLEANLEKANISFSNMDSNPLNGQTSNSIVNASRTISRDISLQFGDTNINTAATDSEGIARSANSELAKQFRTAVENYDDGVAI